MSQQLLKDQYIQVEDIRTHYWAVGDGEKCVVLIHALGGFIEHWKCNIAALSMNHRVYAPDLVGFGRSETPEVPYSIPYLAEFVHLFIQVQGINKATLIGESMGGGIALSFALQYPQQVEKLVLASFVGVGKEAALILRMLTLPVVGELLTLPNRKVSEITVRQLFHNQDKVPESLIKKAYEIYSLPGIQRCYLRTLRSMMNPRGVKSEVYQPILDHLEEIQAPTLVIWGAQDKILPVAHAHTAANRIPNAKLHIFDQCKHIPNIEHAEAFNTLVTNFLTNGSSPAA